MTDQEKREKIVEEFERFMQEYDRDIGFTSYESEVLNGVHELLKAQEPVKPVVDVDTWKCGNCGHTLEHQELLGDNVLFHEQYNYCPECGRKVKRG